MNVFSKGDEKKCVDNITNNNNKKNTTATTPVRKDCKPVEGSPRHSEKQKEAAVGAKNNFYNQEELKAVFAKIDRKLVFDKGFYVKAGTYLTQSGLDDQYLSWLYQQCLLKKPRSLNGLYYTLFSEPNMAELFKAQNIPLNAANDFRENYSLSCVRQ